MIISWIILTEANFEIDLAEKLEVLSRSEVFK